MLLSDEVAGPKRKDDANDGLTGPPSLTRTSREEDPSALPAEAAEYTSYASSNITHLSVEADCGIDKSRKDGGPSLFLFIPATIVTSSD